MNLNHINYSKCITGHSMYFWINRNISRPADVLFVAQLTVWLLLFCIQWIVWIQSAAVTQDSCGKELYWQVWTQQLRVVYFWLDTNRICKLRYKVNKLSKIQNCKNHLFDYFSILHSEFSHRIQWPAFLNHFNNFSESMKVYPLDKYALSGTLLPNLEN